MMAIKERPFGMVHVVKGITFCVCLSSFIFELGTFAFANYTPQKGTHTDYVVWSEDTPLNTVIGNISAFDKDGPSDITFSIPSKFATTKELVELRNYREVQPDTWAMDVVLIKKLDRDFGQTERKLTFEATDGRSTIDLEMALLIQDVNDEPPLFIDLPYKVTVSEDQPVGTVIFSNISVFDPDNGRGSSANFSLVTDVQGADAEYRSTFEIQSGTGVVTLTRSLDYERHTIYIFKVGVRDMGVPSLPGKPADFVVTVLDIQDTPPRFVNLPYNAQIKETASVGTSVLKVSGMDGDQGIPNDLAYSFVSGFHENFAINSSTGWITVKKALDRDSASMAENNGVYAMHVQAEEMEQAGVVNYGEKTVSSMVTITVEDVNDNSPAFNQPVFQASVLENMQFGVPIDFASTDGMRVVDKDQGTNSYFSLSVEQNGQAFTDFSTTPETVYGDAAPVLIRVQNPDALDYEKQKQIIFQVVARELDTAEKRSSTTTVTLSIVDVNDNAPNFTHPEYIFSVSEDAAIGYSVGDILAIDGDTGSYAEVSYSIRGSNEKFRVDPTNGTLYVTGQLDRESMDQYFLSAEAVDGGNLRTTAEIRVQVNDVNDKSPVFRRNDYEGLVRENDDALMRPIKVEALDGDQPTTVNSLVNYRLDGPTFNFSIDVATGDITLDEPLDYEKLDEGLQGKLGLQVVAYDSGTPPMSSSVLVVIGVEDMNDFPPVFDPASYSKSILENSPEGTSVLKVSASDADATSPNHDFFYRIDSGALDKFRMNFSSGEVFVESGARLDREEKREYRLRVSATDRGNSPLTGFSEVTIILDNVNDELPRFAQSSQAVSISENRTVGSSVFSYVATDSDDDSDLRYSLIKDQTKAFDEDGEAVDVSASGVDNYFEVHASNGTVYVHSALDRETAERIMVKILVQDRNAVDPEQQSATATLSIALSDYNDNPPSFEPTDQFFVNVSEAEDVNSVILRVRASDPDRRQQVTYELKRSDSDPLGVDPFSIDEPTGTVVLDQRLDREKKPFHTFIIVATDDGQPSLMSSATVSISVVDQNDNVPQFVAFPQVFSVSENASVGWPVYNITANDYDDGDFGAVIYSLEGVDNEDGKFEINPKSGLLSVARPLDRETKASYRLEVMAQDSDPDIVNRKSKRRGFTIEITDVNDNAPQFEELGSAPSVTEIAEVGRSIFTVVAKDADFGENGTVQYSLDSSATNATVGGRSLFSIVPNTGIVQVAQRLQDQAGIYFLTVAATDQGPQPKFTTRRYVIEVLDVNNVIPRFVQPDTDNAIVQVLEDAPVGTSVIQLSAVDTDSGRNGEVEYTLKKGQSASNLQTFTLNATSGLLSTKTPLDREQTPVYTLTVVATDHGIPNNYSTDLTLIVKVKDVNDQPPLFDRSKLPTPYPVAFTENDTAQACSNVSVAIDLDSDPAFTVICYYLIGAELPTKFQLRRSGQLCITNDQVLDREETAFTNLVLRASDNCNQDTSPQPMLASGVNPPELYSSQDASLLWVRVNVRDVNDNAPAFIRRDLAVGITRDVQLGQVIYSLMDEVVDLDTAQWGVSHFINLTTFQPHPSRLAQELRDAGANTPFLLFNGSVKVNTYFNADMSGYFIVKIRVVDKGRLTDDAQLRISLISDSQRLRVVFREGVGQVGKYKVQFAIRMSEVTGYRIVVDKIQTHESETGTAENDKTDMFIHGEDISTDEIVPAVDLLRTIDELSAEMEMIRVLNDFNILEILELTKTTADDEREKRLQMALILVSVILGVLCIILIIILYCTHKRYNRKLKAATALAYGPQETDLYKVDIPGTNIHSYENHISLDDNALTAPSNHHHHLNNHHHNPRLNHTSTSLHNGLTGVDEQEVCMNIIPEERSAARHRPRHKADNRSRYLKAAISEHDTARNLQANDLAKNSSLHDKMALSSSSTGSANSSLHEEEEEEEEEEGSGENFVLQQASARPIVVRAGTTVRRDYGDGTVTCDINGLPSTEI